MDFDAVRLRSSTVALPQEESKIQTLADRKEKEKAERKARMEAARLKRAEEQGAKPVFSKAPTSLTKSTPAAVFAPVTKAPQIQPSLSTDLKAPATPTPVSTNNEEKKSEPPKGAKPPLLAKPQTIANIPVLAKA